MENETEVCHVLLKGGDMAAGSINILDFAASGGSWGYFGRSAATKTREKGDFVTQVVPQDGPRKPKGCPQEAKRVPKEAPRSPEGRQRGSQRRFWEHYGKRCALPVQGSQDHLGRESEGGEGR